MKNTKKKGFTIVELVIVIAVIGILSAILIPTFSNLVKNANEAKLQADLRNAYTEYAEEAALTETLFAQKDVVLSKKVNETTVYYKYNVDGVNAGKYTVYSATVSTNTVAQVQASATDEVNYEDGKCHAIAGTYNTYTAYYLYTA